VPTFTDVPFFSVGGRLAVFFLGLFVADIFVALAFPPRPAKFSCLIWVKTANASFG